MRAWPRPLRLTLLAILVAASGVSIGLYERHQMYTLSDVEYRIVGRSTVTKKFIKVGNDGISYNRQADESSQAKKIMQLSGLQTDTTGKAPYQATLAKDFNGGLTFADAKKQRQFTMAPQFTGGTAKYADGWVIYPGSASKQVYTFRNNGVKEDIVLATAPGDEVKYSWKLEMGSDLEARMMPNGNVGIYSANPYLFGDVQASDAHDQQLIDKARKSNKKDYLAFVLPAPFIIDASGRKDYKGVSYALNGDTLTINAKSMADRQYPLSIDPTVVVTTTSDFRKGTDDGMIDYSTADQISRAAISGGAVGGTTQQLSAFTGPRYDLASAVSGGYLYIAGGFGETTYCGSGVYCNDVQYCPINSDNSIGTCVQQTSAFTGPRFGLSSVAYNGYLYIIGGRASSAVTGCTASGNYCNDIQYCPINSSTHAIGTCVQEVNAFTLARMDFGAEIYNGNLYIVGGYDSSGSCGSAYCNDIQYCPINADGSIGTCAQQANAFTTPRDGLTSVISNGNLYIIGGAGAASATGCDANGNCNDIQYCPINSDGSVGACVQKLSAFTTPRSFHASVVSDGYLYIIGGAGASSATGCDVNGYCNDIQYCPLNANGSVGTCTQETSAFTTPRSDLSSVFYNGYIYLMGGMTGATASGCDASWYCNDIQRLPISSPPPSLGASVQQASAFPTARGYDGSVVYNGYLYIIGGYGSGYLTDVPYCPINADGSIGSCTDQANVISGGRYGAAFALYNNYFYVIGGYTGSLQNDIQSCPIQSDHSIATCTVKSAAFTTARSYPSAVVTNGYLYIIGGYDNASTNYNDIQYCPLNADGTVGTCTQQTNAFPTARRSHTSVVYNGYLYIIGGYTTTSVNDIAYCPILSNHSIGTCTDQSAAFTTARSGHASVFANGYLYIIGGTAANSATGCDSSGNCNDIQYCPLNANGSVGTCTQKLSAFTTGRYYFPSVIYNSYLYIIGGSGATYYNDIQRIPMATASPGFTGAPGTGSAQTGGVPSDREYDSSVVYNGYMYIVGGENAGTFAAYSDIVSCRLDANGSVTVCNDQASMLNSTRYSMGLAVYKGYLYITGGAIPNGALNPPTANNDIQYCPINTDHSVGACVTNTTGFTTARYAHTSVVSNGYLYIIGGQSASAGVAGCDPSYPYCNDIQYCPLNANGSVGTCTQKTSAFTTPRFAHTSVVSNGYLYIIGGYAAPSATGCDANSFCNDIQYCPLNANGSVGTCTQKTSAFTTTRRYFSSVAYNGYLYVIGGQASSSGTGCDANGYCNDIQYCPLNANGSVGTCTQKTSALLETRTGLTSVAYSGYIYVVSGISTTTTGSCDAAGYCNKVESYPLLAPMLLGNYEITLDIGSSADISGIQYDGTAACGINVSYEAADSSGVFGTQSTITALASGTSYNPSLSSKRYVRLLMSLDDSSCAGTTTVTDIILTYVPPPPAVPTLITPAANVRGQATQPSFTFRTTDTLTPYVRYKIDICNNATCSSILQTGDQTSSQTGWTGQDAQTGTAYNVSGTITSSTIATYTYQGSLSLGTQYWWRAYAIDPLNGSAWSNPSSIQSFYTESISSAPVLVAPASSMTNVSLTPLLTLHSTDADGDYLKYRIDICTTSNCSSILTTMDQTASQTGWADQNAASGTAYSSDASVLANSQLGVYSIPSGVLSAGTQYWWRAYSIDPAGTNTWSAASGIQSFTTGATTNSVKITGGTKITGGVHFGN